MWFGSTPSLEAVYMTLYDSPDPPLLVVVGTERCVTRKVEGNGAKACASVVKTDDGIIARSHCLMLVTWVPLSLWDSLGQW